MIRFLAAGAFAIAFAAAPMSAAFADRAPSAYENADIGNVLFQAGFSSWGTIEWDEDGYWKVENAIDADGKRRDIVLDETLMIVKSDSKIRLFD